MGDGGRLGWALGVRASGAALHHTDPHWPSPKPAQQSRGPWLVGNPGMRGLPKSRAQSGDERAEASGWVLRMSPKQGHPAPDCAKAWAATGNQEARGLGWGRVFRYSPGWLSWRLGSGQCTAQRQKCVGKGAELEGPPEPPGWQLPAQPSSLSICPVSASVSLCPGVLIFGCHEDSAPLGPAGPWNLHPMVSRGTALVELCWTDGASLCPGKSTILDSTDHRGLPRNTNREL